MRSIFSSFVRPTSTLHFWRSADFSGTLFLPWSAADEMAPRCHLLGGSFASAIQACLAVVCVGTLIVKRHYEHPRRDWMVWFLDVLKQGCGSSVGHFANIYLSQVIAYTIRDADECQWYCFTYLVDCTLGITMNVFFLRLFERAVDRYPLTCRIMKFGDYGDPPQLHYFVMQLVAWVSIVVTVKAIILSLMLHVLLPINGFIAYLFTAFEGHARLELVMVMVIIPTVLNTLAFWVTDTFLKRQFGFSEHMPLRTEDDDGDDDDFDRHLVDEMNLELTIVSDKSNPPSFPKSPKGKTNCALPLPASRFSSASPPNFSSRVLRPWSDTVCVQFAMEVFGLAIPMRSRPCSSTLVCSLSGLCSSLLRGLAALRGARPPRLRCM